MNNIDWGFVQTLIILLGAPSLSGLIIFLWRQYNVRKANINRIRLTFEVGKYGSHDENGVWFVLLNNSGYTLRDVKPKIKILKRYGDPTVSKGGLWEDYTDFQTHPYNPLPPDEKEVFTISYLKLARFLGGGEELWSYNPSRIRIRAMRDQWLRIERPHYLITLFWPKPVTLLIELSYFIDDKGLSIERHIFSLKCRFPETLERKDLTVEALSVCGELTPLKTPVWLTYHDWLWRAAATSSFWGWFLTIAVIVLMLLVIYVRVQTKSP